MDRDAILEIIIADDRMSVYGTFLPPVGEGRAFSPDYVDAVLHSSGVVAGVQGETVAEAMFACNTERRAQKEILLAIGTPPVEERPAYWRIDVLTGEESDDTVHPEGEKIDYKGETHVGAIHAGDQIASLIPAAEGEAGIDVLGNELPFTTQAVPQLQPGTNTHVDGEHAYAEVGGRITVSATEFAIEDRLEITGEVGYATGSIEFPGEVIVKGEIKEGFHIWAGKSITADRTVDVSEIYCRGAFASAGGIIGRGKALLRSGDTVQVRFIGNCFVESKSSIAVKQYVYNSYLGCLGSFSMDKTGRVVGGVITAAGGVSCHTIGNTAGISTCLRGGIDFIAERKHRLSREKHQQITLRLQKLVARLGDNPTDRQLDILRRLEDAQNRYARTLGEMAEILDTNEEAEVVATGDVYPGTRIQICRAEYIVREKLKAVRFYLEKERGRVLVVPLTPSKSESADSDTPPQS